MKTNKLTIFLTFILLPLLAHAQAHAQEEGASSTQATEQKEVLNDDVTFKERTYKFASFENMADIYWRYGLASTSSIEDVENYMRINECQIYQKYHMNEFEWRPILETMIEYLEENKSTFNEQFYYIVPVELGEYNFENGHFPVANQKLREGLRLFSPMTEGYRARRQNQCEMQSIDTSSYPRDTVIQLYRPFYIPYVEAERLQAKNMVKRWEQDVRDRTFGSKEMNRVAYARVYLDFMRYEPADEKVEGMRSRLIAKVDGYEIFETQALTNMITSKSYKRGSD